MWGKDVEVEVFGIGSPTKPVFLPKPRTMSSSVPGRKKSLIGANGAQIDIPSQPQVTNQLLNKSAANSTSLYQQCSALRNRLDRVHDFAPFLALANSTASTADARRSQVSDPVRQLWDCFAMGTPLCFLYNLLPIPHKSRIDINTDPAELDVNDMRNRKQAIAKFIVAITTLQKTGDWEQGEVFTVMELVSSQRDTNGFVKVCPSTH
jgi:cell division control protein 24